MKQLLVMLAAAVCFVIAVAAHAAHGATLRPQIVVTGDQVTLGDLFDGLPADRAMVPVARAPAPGCTVTLEAGWITRVVLTYGVAWTPARADLRVAIHRADARRELAALAGAMHDQLSAVFARADAAAPAAEAAPPPLPPRRRPPSHASVRCRCSPAGCATAR